MSFFKSRKSENIEVITYQEAFDRIFERLDNQEKIINEKDYIINELKLENIKMKNKINYIEEKLKYKHEELKIISNNLQEKFDIIGIKLEKIIYENNLQNNNINILNFEIKELKNDTKEENKIMKERIENTKIETIDFIDKSSKEAKLSIDYFSLNKNRYYYGIHKLYESLEIENSIFREIEKTKYLPINANNPHQYWFFVNIFTNIELIKKYLNISGYDLYINEKYGFEIVKLFNNYNNNSSGKLYYDTVKNNNCMRYFRNRKQSGIWSETSNEPPIINNKKCLIDKKIHSYNNNCSISIFDYDTVYKKSFENINNELIDNINFENDYYEIENLILESFERIECLKMIRDNKYDISL